MKQDFIPARESKLFIFFFKWYSRWLINRRCQTVWIAQNYEPDSKPTLYFLNHHAWWDGLIPLLLNEFRFGQNARAIMEDRQMQKYKFFSRIGAMSVNRSDARSALHTIAQAAEWLHQQNNCLFLYPEGKITLPSEPIKFESGILRIIDKCPEADLVPITIHFSMQRGDRPELFMKIGPSLTIPEHITGRERLTWLESVLHAQLVDTQLESKNDNHSFSKLFR